MVIGSHVKDLAFSYTAVAAGRFLDELRKAQYTDVRYVDLFVMRRRSMFGPVSVPIEYRRLARINVALLRELGMWPQDMRSFLLKILFDPAR